MESWPALVRTKLATNTMPDAGHSLLSTSTRANAGRAESTNPRCISRLSGPAASVAHRLADVYYLVPLPPSPPVSWNHRVGGNFLLRSLNPKDLYQSILE